MKALLNLVLVMVLLFALVLTLYGSMKLSRISDQSQAAIDLSSGSSVMMESPRGQINPSTVNKILGAGITGMLLSGAGLVFVQRSFKGRGTR